MSSSMASTALLNVFKANKPAFGVWLTLPGSFHARAVAQATPHLSWIAVDCEHGLVPLHPGAAETIHAISSTRYAPSAIVRIPSTGVSSSTSWQIKYALDAGAQGVIVPMISTVEKAREVVQDCKFPPLGRRGWGNPFTQDIWQQKPLDYLATANENILVMVQIETREAVENTKDIASVNGVDVLFIGPYDLSIALGYQPPSPDPHPDVEKIIQKILEDTHVVGKKCAIFCTSGAQAAIRAKEGFDMINVTSDTGSLTDGLSQHFEAAVA